MAVKIGTSTGNKDLSMCWAKKPGNNLPWYVQKILVGTSYGNDQVWPPLVTGSNLSSLMLVNHCYYSYDYPTPALPYLFRLIIYVAEYDFSKNKFNLSPNGYWSNSDPQFSYGNPMQMFIPNDGATIDVPQQHIYTSYSFDVEPFSIYQSYTYSSRPSLATTSDTQFSIQDHTPKESGLSAYYSNNTSISLDFIDGFGYPDGRLQLNGNSFDWEGSNIFMYDLIKKQ
jgi:hypothetical protein